ncbi:MAG: hypothetical protein HY905_21950 [Deltaproteobacteria bacterium]|nr:hypothetical protein [Deltaproteobacteria bacterium]
MGDGRIAYQVRHPLGPGKTHRIMTPLELMARLAALVPPLLAAEAPAKAATRCLPSPHPVPAPSPPTTGSDSTTAGSSPVWIP